jgi:integration host factor subunit beta
MTKSDLINSVAKRYPALKMHDIKKLVDIIFAEITSALASKQRIEIRGFGSMSIRERKARLARNPKTNESIELMGRNVVYFRMGKEFFNRLNPVNAK